MEDGMEEHFVDSTIDVIVRDELIKQVVLGKWIYCKTYTSFLSNAYLNLVYPTDGKLVIWLQNVCTTSTQCTPHNIHATLTHNKHLKHHWRTQRRRYVRTTSTQRWHNVRYVVAMWLKRNPSITGAQGYCKASGSLYNTCPRLCYYKRSYSLHLLFF